MFSSYFKDLKKEFAGYSFGKLAKDAMAGVTVCAVALPLALAFGVSSGATAAAGLVTAIIAGIVIGMLSGASYQISGPTGAMSAVLITVVAKYGFKGVLFASFCAGIILLLCGIFKLGRLISFIPMPVVMGFTSGIALTIALGQVDNFFGTTSSGTSVIEKLSSYGTLGFKVNIQAMIIGLIVIAVMIVWPKKLNDKIPSSLIAIIVATVISVVFKMNNLALVGDIPKTLMLDERLSFADFNFSMLAGLASPIFTIAALAMIESLLCGASASSMKGEPFNADRELIAQGVGNMLIPFFGGVPATAAIARTGVAIKSGEQTRLTGVFHSLFLLVSMFVLGPVMAKLPLSALAGVLMMTSFRMNDWKGIKYIFGRKFKSAIAQYLLTMVATVLFDLTVAIVLGVLVSAIMFVASSAKLRVNVSERKEDDACVIYINGAMFFGAEDKLVSSLEKIPEEKHIIVSLRGVPTMDVCGARALSEAIERMKNDGHSVSICGISDDVVSYLRRAGVYDLVGEDSVYAGVDDAIISLVENENK